MKAICRRTRVGRAHPAGQSCLSLAAARRGHPLCLPTYVNQMFMNWHLVKDKISMPASRGIHVKNIFLPLYFLCIKKTFDDLCHL